MMKSIQIVSLQRLKYTCVGKTPTARRGGGRRGPRARADRPRVRETVERRTNGESPGGPVETCRQREAPARSDLRGPKADEARATRGRAPDRPRVRTSFDERGDPRNDASCRTRLAATRPSADGAPAGKDIAIVVSCCLLGAAILAFTAPTRPQLASAVLEATTASRPPRLLAAAAASEIVTGCECTLGACCARGPVSGQPSNDDWFEGGCTPLTTGFVNSDMEVACAEVAAGNRSGATSVCEVFSPRGYSSDESRRRRG